MTQTIMPEQAAPITPAGELPEGWVESVLPQIAEITMGQSPPGSSYNEEGKGLPFFQGKTDFGDRHPTVRVWCTQPTKIAKPGDVLITVRAPVGPTNVADRRCAIGRGLAAFTPSSGIATEFLLFALRLKEPELALSGTGSTFTAISKKDIESIAISVPPLQEQVRIVRKIEELLAYLNGARDHLSRVPAILKRFRQAVLAAACSGRLTQDWRDKMGEVVGPPLRGPESELWPDLPECWRSITVEKACSDVVDCPHSTPKWTSTGVVCLRTTNFKPGVLDLHEVRFVSESTYKDRVSWLEPKAGDVLYSREGGILGIACIIPPNMRLCLGQRMMLMRTSPKLCDPVFLMHVLNSPTILAQVRDLTGGSASPHLNVGDIKAFPMPHPCLEEQREIVRRVAALFSLTDTIDRRAATFSELADNLTKSILAKAFRGELVPTEAELARREGREYESASVLLERIEKQRESKTSSKPERKRPRTKVGLAIVKG